MLLYKWRYRERGREGKTETTCLSIRSAPGLTPHWVPVPWWANTPLSPRRPTIVDNTNTSCAFWIDDSCLRTTGSSVVSKCRTVCFRLNPPTCDTRGWSNGCWRASWMEDTWAFYLGCSALMFLFPRWEIYLSFAPLKAQMADWPWMGNYHNHPGDK